MKKTIAALAATALLAGCGFGGDDNAPQPKPTASKPADPRASMPPAQRKLEDSLAKVAPADREDFQKALTCAIKKNGEDKPLSITADYVDGLYARYKTDKSIASC